MQQHRGKCRVLLSECRSRDSGSTTRYVSSVVGRAGESWNSTLSDVHTRPSHSVRISALAFCLVEAKEAARLCRSPLRWRWTAASPMYCAQSAHFAFGFNDWSRRLSCQICVYLAAWPDRSGMALLRRRCQRFETDEDPHIVRGLACLPASPHVGSNLLCSMKRVDGQRHRTCKVPTPSQNLQSSPAPSLPDRYVYQSHSRSA